MIIGEYSEEILPPLWHGVPCALFLTFSFYPSEETVKCILGLISQIVRVDLALGMGRDAHVMWCVATIFFSSFATVDTAGIGCR